MEMLKPYKTKKLAASEMEQRAECLFRRFKVADKERRANLMALMKRKNLTREDIIFILQNVELQNI